MAYQRDIFINKLFSGTNRNLKISKKHIFVINFIKVTLLFQTIVTLDFKSIALYSEISIIGPIWSNFQVIISKMHSDYRRWSK